MPITAEVIDRRTHACHTDAFARDVLSGLSRHPKSLSSAWFYDDVGSRLFEQITQLDEYYHTRCEHEILSRHAGDIAAAMEGASFRVLEIGAGDGHKTEILLHAFLKLGLEFEYVPIDICHRSIVELVAKLRSSIDADAFTVRGIVAEYHDALLMLRERTPMRNLVLFLGSSIGNFEHGDARRFLHNLRRMLEPGDAALIGFDLKKDPAILQPAYDDALGVTREFNLNLLDRINRELGGDFERGAFQHHPTYNPLRGCMESWLISREDQTVTLADLDRSFHFAAYEAIKVECSYKYDPALIDSLAASSGFEVDCDFYDRRRYFVDSLWRAA
jgi:dimethylhistidine N-methyltransferase